MIFEKVLTLLTVLLLFHTFEAQDASKSCSAGERRVSGKCELCPPGTYRKHIPLSWYKNEDECQLCPKGTFQAHFGAVGEDLCQKCPLGTFAAKEGSAACEKCVEGEIAPTGSSGCIACPGGSEARIYEGEKLRCEECGRDYYRSIEMNTCMRCPSRFTTEGERGAKSCVRCGKDKRCFRCARNYYRPSWNLSCLQCPGGTYTKGRFASSVSECLPCPEGTFRRIWDYSCEQCPRGSVTGPGGMLCRREGTPCPLKFFENSVGDCHTCASGYRLNRALLQCEKCPDGSVSGGGIAENCDACPENQMASETGEKCECPDGRYLRGEKCVMCPIGTTIKRSYRRKFCQRCLRGQAPRRGMTECIPCDTGSAFDCRRRRCVRCDGKDQLILGTGINKRCVEPRTGCREDEFRVYHGFGFEFRHCKRRVCTDETLEEDIGVKCVLCKKGFYVGEFEDPALWWTMENECVRCFDDETSEGGTTSTCVKCPRYHRRDSISGGCICEEGLVKKNDSCTFCPHGSASEDGLTCTLCKPGFFANPFTKVCLKCVKGSYSPGGAPVCLKCPSRTRPNRNVGATMCVPLVSERG